MNKLSITLITLALIAAACGSEPAPETIVIPEDVEAEVQGLELNECVDVVAAVPGEFDEGCLDGNGVFNLFGVMPCGDTESIVFDAENGGVWFGVFGTEWQLLETDQYTATFVEEQCA